MLGRISFVATAAVLVASPAAADDPGAGLYGLLDGDFSLDVGAGGGGHVAADGAGAAAAVEGRLRYLATAAVVLGYDLRPQDGKEGHALVAAAELRPLFFPLFFENGFTGHRRTDLVLYGLGLTGGIQADLGGFSLVTGIGTEWPLPGEGIAGLFIRTELRGRFADESWQHASGDVVEAAALVLLQWHEPLDLGIVR